MTRSTIFLGIAFVFGLLLTSGIGYAFDWATEAEMAATIEAPMVVGTSSDAAAQGGPEPSAPSRGNFVWMPGPPVAGGGGEGWAEFTINIPAAGTYALWGKVTAWDGNSDSFWVTWQPADPDEDAQETQNTQFRWGVAQGNDWHWDKINHWLDGGTFEREWRFDTAGKTTLRIGVREDATMLDVIFVTDNLSDDEAEVNPRDPTAEDLVSVEPQGKLATSWAQIKAR
ncbi:hypothetical protein IH992_04825 [Candidatus Poribacteria bacterium]|nr:hypothetical protein [Candidatus Poribacteria bacterium]